MRKLAGVIIVGGAIMVAGCKKEPLPVLPEGNDPVYKLSGLVDNDPLNFTVGKETVVMNYGLGDENGVITYYGEMESELKNEKLRIEFVRQEKPRNSDGEVIFHHNPRFLVHEKGRVEFDFGGIGNQSSYMMFEDANGNFVSSDELELNEFGFITVNVIFSDYGNTPFDFEVKHGFREDEFNSAYHAQGTGNIIVLEALMEDNDHEWYIDGILVGTESTYQGETTDGVHRIRHRVIDPLGNESSSKSLVRFKGGKQFWDMKIEYADELVFDEYNYGRVIVSMFKNGEWYSSDHAVSNKSGIFNIDNSKFIPNEGGECPLMAFDFDFDAVLLNEDQSDSLNLSDFSGKFLVGLE